MRLIALLVALLPLACGAAVQQPNIWPLPQEYKLGTAVLTIPSTVAFSLSVDGSSGSSPLLDLAFERYRGIMFPLQQSNEKPLNPSVETVEVHVASTNEKLQLDTDESYTVQVSADAKIVIGAPTVFGALRGLETLSQMVEFDYDSQTYQLETAQIADHPRFAHRGLLVDTSRHFLPLPTLQRLLDSMSFAKLNVLHWHIVDNESFGVQSHSYPKLWQGAWSKRERYTQMDIASVVKLGLERGIRVMPEFDGPGHSYAWGVGYPQILPADFNAAGNCLPRTPGRDTDVPVDPSNPFVYELLEGLFGEMTGKARGKGLFPDDFFHIGGDEVQFDCWMHSAAISAFMAKQGWAPDSYDKLYMYFVQKSHAIASGFGRSAVVWEEVWNHFGTQLPKDTVVEIWKAHDVLVNVTAHGYRGILANSNDWYLDHLDTTWETFYANDPFQNITNPDQQKLVLGGEVCMWGETMDTSDLENTVWPRAAAGAERLWSSQSVTSTADALPRLRHFRCLLNRRGIAAAPVDVNGRGAPTGPNSCYAE